MKKAAKELDLVAPQKGGHPEEDRGPDPEFDRWRWVDFWKPVNEVIYFKRRVYARALHELGPHVFPDGLPPHPRWWPKRWRAVFDKDLKAAGKTPASNAGTG